MNDAHRGRQIPLPMLAMLIAGYLLLICIGYLVFRSGSAMVRGNEMSRDRALFTVINAVTLSGFQQTVATNEYLMPGKITVMALMAGGAFFYLCAGGMAVSRIARLSYTDAEVVAASMALLGLGTLAGTALMARGEPLFDTMFLSISAIGNCGLHIGALPPVDDMRTHAVLLPLSIVGGLGAVVLLDLKDLALRRRAHLSSFTQAVLTTTAILYLVAIVAFFCMSDRDSARASLVAASTHALNSRGAGFAFEFAHVFSRPVQWIYLVLMLIGAASAGTAGGLKVNTIHEIGVGITAAVRRRPLRRSFGIAIAWMMLYLTLIFLGLLMLLETVPQMPADRLLFIAVSAVGNVGASHDPVAIVKDGLNVLSLLMILGRAASLAVLWWLACSAREEAEAPVG